MAYKEISPKCTSAGICGEAEQCNMYNTHDLIKYVWTLTSIQEELKDRQLKIYPCQ